MKKNHSYEYLGKARGPAGHLSKAWSEMVEAP